MLQSSGKFAGVNPGTTIAEQNGALTPTVSVALNNAGQAQRRKRIQLPSQAGRQRQKELQQTKRILLKSLRS